MDNLSINGNGSLNTPGLGQFWQKGWEIENQLSEGQAPAVVPPPPFSPADIANLGLWLRSDLGITLNGSDVSAWADQSGSGNNVSQGTASRQPAYNASGGPNSLPSLDFTFTDRHLLASGAVSLLSAVAGYTLYLVLKRPNTTINTISLSFENASMTDQVVTDIAYCYADSATYANAASTDTDWMIRKTVFDGSQGTDAGRMKSYENGVQQTLSFTGVMPAVTASSAFFLIGDYFSDLPVWDFDGSIVEILVWPRTLTGGEQTQVDDYLSTRYSIV